MKRSSNGQLLLPSSLLLSNFLQIPLLFSSLPQIPLLLSSLFQILIPSGAFKLVANLGVVVVAFKLVTNLNVIIVAFQACYKSCCCKFWYCFQVCYNKSTIQRPQGMIIPSLLRSSLCIKFVIMFFNHYEMHTCILMYVSKVFGVHELLCSITIL